MAEKDESAKEFAAAAKEFRIASQELSQNTGKEVGKIVGKDLLKVTDPFVNSFKQIPGVQTLGAVGKTLFNKGFAKLKDNREKKLLADRLGLTKSEFKVMEQTKRNNDAFKKMNEKMMDAAENLLGFDKDYINLMNERNEKGQFRSTKEMVAAIESNRDALLEEARQNNILEEGRINMAKKTQMNRAKQEELEAKKAAEEGKNRSILERIAAGLIGKKGEDGEKGSGGGILGKLLGGKKLLIGAALGAALLAILAFVNSPYWEKTKKIFKEDILPALKNLYENVLTPIWEEGVQFFLNQWENIKVLFDDIGESIKKFKEGDILGGITTLIGGLGTFFTDTVDNLITSVYNLFAGLFGLEKTDSVFGEIGRFIDDTWNSITKFFTDLYDGVVDVFPNPLAEFRKLWTELTGEGGLLDIVFSPIETVINEVKSLFDKILNIDVSSILKKIPGGETLAGLIFGEEKTPEQIAQEEAEEAARKERQRQQKEEAMRKMQVAQLEKTIRRKSGQLGRLEKDAAVQDRGRTVAGFRITSGESDEEHRRDNERFIAAQKEMDALKAELAALRAGGGDTVVNAPSSTSTDQSKKFTVTPMPLNDPNNYPAEAY